ncbi:MAG: MFS transporter, partial [Flavobacteriaceae bacterium]
FPMIGLFLAPLYPLVNSAVLTSMPKERHSSLAGLLTFFSAIGGTVGSLVVGHMFDTIGGDKVFYLSLVPLGIMLVLFFFLNRFTKA